MSSTSPAGPAGAVRERVPFWDNARFVCIALVVAGHAIQRLTSGSDSALVLYLFIYAFHMPAFAIISGYFSKAGPPTAAQMQRVITDILLPYVIMESIWTLVKFAVNGTLSVNFTTASWTLWFLLALGIFRLLLPYLALVRWPLMWAVAFSVGVGYLENVDSTFSLSRAIGILPFFVLGWKLQHWRIIDAWRAVDDRATVIRLAAVAVLIGWIAVLATSIELWRAIDLRYWFFYLDPYTALGGDQWWAGLLRLAVLALAVILTAAVFVLIPRRQTWFTRFGQATMYVYLLHSFVLYPIRESGLLGGQNSGLPWLVGMLALSLVITLVLASPWVRRATRPLIEPKPRWLFLPADGSPPSAPSAGSSPTDPTGVIRQ
jgi:fucose 4-O-acetylase-like acetyltransferase